MAENNEIREESVVVGRTIGVLVLLTGLLLAAHLCVATPPPSDNPIPSIFEPHSTPADSIYHLSHFVLSITALIFLVVFSLLSYVVVKFRGRAADMEREPAQVYGSAERETYGYRAHAVRRLPAPGDYQSSARTRLQSSGRPGGPVGDR